MFFIFNVGLFRGINVYVEFVKKEGLNYVILCYFKICNVLRVVLKVFELELLVKDDVYVLFIVILFVLKN